MANGISEWFGLKRNNYLINPKKEADFYAPRRDVNIPSIVEDLQISLITNVTPKRLFWGIYGGGKTHTLFKITKELEKLTDIYTVYIECPTASKKSTFHHYYQDGIMSSIGQGFIVNLFEDLLQSIGITQPKERLQKVKKITEDEELSRAVDILLLPGMNRRLLFWKYISGFTIKNLSELGVAQSLADAEPAKLANIIVILGRVLRIIRKKTLVLILDELDRLRVINDEAAILSFITAFRRLLGTEQNEVALVIGCSAATLRDIPYIFGEGGPGAGLGPVLGKIGKEGLIEISGIDIADFDNFVKSIINYVRNPEIDINKKIAKIGDLKETIDPYTFPFTIEAIETLKGVIREEAITPMEITRRMTQAIGRAYLLKKLVVTTDSIK